jgi:hypothetical protein
MFSRLNASQRRQTARQPPGVKHRARKKQGSSALAGPTAVASSFNITMSAPGSFGFTLKRRVEVARQLDRSEVMLRILGRQQRRKWFRPDVRHLL